MVTQQSYFYEINIDWAKSASWVCQSTSKLVIKIIKAFFSVRPIVLYDASGILMKKSHSLACQINSATRHSRWSSGMFRKQLSKIFLNKCVFKYSTRLDTMRCDAKRSLSLNFFLIDFSRAILGMHWHQARPEAPLPRCPDAPMHMSIVRRIACLVAAVHSFPLHFSKTVCLPKFMCIFHCFLFSSSLHFCIFFL